MIDDKLGKDDKDKIIYLKNQAFIWRTDNKEIGCWSAHRPRWSCRARMVCCRSKNTDMIHRYRKWSGDKAADQVMQELVWWCMLWFADAGAGCWCWNRSESVCSLVTLKLLLQVSVTLFCKLLAAWSCWCLQLGSVGTAVWWRMCPLPDDTGTGTVVFLLLSGWLRHGRPVVS